MVGMGGEGLKQSCITLQGSQGSSSQGGFRRRFGGRMGGQQTGSQHPMSSHPTGLRQQSSGGQQTPGGWSIGHGAC